MTAATLSIKARAMRVHLGDPLYRTGYLLMLGTGLGAVLGFAFWILAARSYSPHVVGINSAAISAMMLISGACNLGLNAVLVRYLPAAGRASRGLIARAYVVTVVLSLVVAAAAALSSGLWSDELRFLREPAWLAGFTVSTAVWTVFSLQDSVMTGLRAAHVVPIENSLFSVAKLAALVALPGLMPIAGPFVAWNAPVGAAVVAITLLIFRRLLPRHEAAAPAGEMIGRERLLRVAAGNYGGTLFSLAATLFLPVLVASTTTATQTAYFYMPFTVATALQLVALNMTTSLTVEAAVDAEALRALARRTLSHVLRLLVPVVAATAILAPVVLRAFGEDYASAGATLLRLLTLGAIPNAVVVLGLSVERIRHRGTGVMAIQAAQCVLVLGLSALLLPAHGITGVGLAWLVSQTALALVLVAGPLRALLR